MTPHRMIALVLLIALLVTAVTPARAEAMEIGTVLLIAGAVVAVIMIIAYLVVANVSERRRAGDDTPTLVVVYYVVAPEMAPHVTTEERPGEPVALLEFSSAP